MITLKKKLFTSPGFFIMVLALTLVSAIESHAQDTALTAFQPFIDGGVMSNIGVIVQFNVPDGKRYVIERVTADFRVPHGTKLGTITLKTFVNGIAAVHVLPRPSLTYKEFSGPIVKWDHYILSTAVRLYADGFSKINSNLIK